jgi:short-subunit dehydrogenase
MDYQGKTALITGASSGIGEAFAHALAGRGMNLILAARSRAKLEALAATVAKQHGVRAEALTVDVSEAAIGHKLAKRVSELAMHVDMLVNNAGFGTYGAFDELQPEREQEEIAVNVAAVVDLTHAFLPAMLERGEGVILNVASVAGFQPTPYMSVYGATKAFVLSFSEGLWAEYKGRGIQVMALCPGPVATGFFAATGNPRLEMAMKKAPMMSPEDVVKRSLKALSKGKSFCIPGHRNYAMAFSSRLAPRPIMARLTAQVLKPRRRQPKD